MRRSMAAVVCALAAGPGRACAAAYTFTTIDAPALPGIYYTSETELFGINDQGTIVGSTVRTGNPTVSFGSVVQSFMYANGTFTPINPPNDVFTGSTSVSVQGINNAGQIVGFYTDLVNYRGFVDTDGVFVTLPLPSTIPLSASGGVKPLAINNLGQVVGSYVNSTNNTGGTFLYSDGVSTMLPFGGYVNLTGINDSGQITIYAHQDSYFDTGSGVAIISPFGYSLYADAQAINDAGVIVGTYFANGGTYGFVDDNGVFATLDVPASVSYYPNTIVVSGINNAGDIVGWYQDASRIEHGFLDTPVAMPEPETIAVLLVGLAALGLAKRSRWVC